MLNHTLDKTIAQSIPNPQFSQFFAKASTATGAGGLLEIKHDYNARGAKLILLHSIVLFTPTAATLHQLVDNFNRVLMDFKEDVSMNGMYPFNFLIESSLIKLTLTNSIGSAVTFTAIYQYIYNGDLPEKK